MRIAIEASTWVNLRGYGRFTREITRALIALRTGHEVTVVVDSGSAAAPDLPDVPRIIVPTTHAVTAAAGVQGARSLWDVWRMSRRLSSGAFDAVVFPTVYSFVPVTGRARVLVVIHDALPETMPRLVLGSRRAELFWRAKTSLACRRADVLATVSQASAAALRKHLPVGDKAIAVLTEGVSPVFSPVESEGDDRLVRTHVPPGARIVLYVGGISPHKRLPDLVTAFGMVRRSSPATDIVLVLAGPVAEDRFAEDQSNIEGAISALGEDAGRVIRTGYVPDATLAALYRAAECVVLPSASEGFGLPALEAMASGRPLLVARSPALVEVCGDAAEYVDDIARLSQRLTTLLHDESARARLGRAGLERARSFGWDEGARRLLIALEGA